MRPVLGLLAAAVAVGATMSMCNDAQSTEERRHPEDVSPRQPAERLDPRGGDRSRPSCRSWRCSTTSSSSTSTSRRTASTRSCPISPRAGRGARTSTELTFKLREGVKWHDGKPFTAADVKCTWDLLLGKARGQAPHQPAQGVVRQRRRGRRANGDHEATFHLKRPQPALLALLASGYSPIYPCHVPPARDAHHPIGTGPFKFVEFKPNETSSWRAIPTTGRRAGPISTASSTRSSRTASTAVLAFVAGPIRHDVSVRGDGPAAQGHEEPGAARRCARSTSMNNSTNLIVNRDKPPFDNPELRQGDGAGARPQGVHRHHHRGQGRDRRRRCCRRPKASGACRRRC